MIIWIRRIHNVQGFQQLSLLFQFGYKKVDNVKRLKNTFVFFVNGTKKHQIWPHVHLMLDYFCMDEIGLDFNPPLQSNWTFYHVKKLLCRHRIHSCQQNERYINTTPLIVVSCSLNVRRNSVHSTGDSSLFDQNNCPIRVLKREKKFPVRLPQLILLLWCYYWLLKKSLIGVKSGQKAPQFCIQLVCNSHLRTWILLIGP